MRMDDNLDSACDGQIPGAADLQKSVQALFGTSVQLSVGSTSNPGIPSLLSSRDGGELPVSSKEAILVGCGAASGGLCALRFDRQEAVNQFARANPLAARTLSTRGLGEELLFWYYCVDWTPSNTTTGNLAWFSQGLIPLMWSDERLESRVVKSLPVAKVQFAELQWDPEAERRFWLARQERLYGPVFRKIGPRKRVLNGSIVCRVFAKDTEVIFDTVGRRFLQKGESGNWEHLSTEMLSDKFTAWLEHWANLCDGRFPVNELRLPRVQSLIQQLKLIAATYEPDPQEGLERYVRDRLCSKLGASLTVNEIYANYEIWARQSQIGRYPRCKFYPRLPGVICDIFGGVRANNVPRWNQKKGKMTDRRGFNGLAFRPDTSDGADASDGPNGNP
jgi:hypothetical protein